MEQPLSPDHIPDGMIPIFLADDRRKPGIKACCDGLEGLDDGLRQLASRIYIPPDRCSPGFNSPQPPRN
jgi:hypothetical protein